MFMCVPVCLGLSLYLCLSVCTCTGSHRGQKKVSDVLVLELQVVLIHLTYLATEPILYSQKLVHEKKIKQRAYAETACSLPSRPDQK